MSYLDFVWTLTGRLDPCNPTVDQIRIRDIARGLSTSMRYRGHTVRPYSVAEHSVILSLIVPQIYARQALMHDASEAYLGDVLRPLKYMPFMAPFRVMELGLDAIVRERFGIVSTFDSRTTIKSLELRLVSTEITQLISPDVGLDLNSVYSQFGQPLDLEIPCLSIQDAECLFVSRFAELFPEQLSGD